MFRGLHGREPAIEASGLQAIARQQLKDATALPPCMAALVNAPAQATFPYLAGLTTDPAQRADKALAMSLLCFPLEPYL